MVAAWRASGLGPTAWCQAQGIPRSALGSCRQRVARGSGFLRVLPIPGSGVVIELPEGLRITGLAPSEVAAVVLAITGGGR